MLSPAKPRPISQPPQQTAMASPSTRTKSTVSIHHPTSVSNPAMSTPSQRKPPLALNNQSNGISHYSANSNGNVSPSAALKAFSKMSLQPNSNSENESEQSNQRSVQINGKKPLTSSAPAPVMAAPTQAASQTTPILRRTRSRPNEAAGSVNTPNAAPAGPGLITSASPAMARSMKMSAPTTPSHSHALPPSASSPITSVTPASVRKVISRIHPAAQTPVRKPIINTYDDSSSHSAVNEPPTPSKQIFSPHYHDQHPTTADQHLHRVQQAPPTPVAAVVRAQSRMKAQTTPPHANIHVQQQQEEEDEDDEFDPFLFIKHLPPLSHVQTRGRVVLPRKSPNTPRVTLALDLDETLVHCSVQPIAVYDFTFSVQFNGMDYTVYVRVRPFMQEFLRAVASRFEVVIFTASQRVYADKLLNILDPQHQYIHHRIFRDSCTIVEGNYLKDLTVLGRDMNLTCIIDNSIQAFGFHLDHGIPIESWFEDPNDRELLNLIPFMEVLSMTNDVKPHIRSMFKLQQYVDKL